MSLHDPELVIPRMAFGLAWLHHLLGKAIAAGLEKKPDLGTVAIMRQFDGLIRRTFPHVPESPSTGPLVIILDTMDKCGTETRRQLLSMLREMSDWCPGSRSF